MTFTEILLDILPRKEEEERRTVRDTWTHDGIPQEDSNKNILGRIKANKTLRTFVKLSSIRPNVR